MNPSLMAKKAQATWGGRFAKGPAKLMQSFSESVSFDKRLAPYDIAVNRAHTAMLCHIGLLSKRELSAIHKGLATIEKRIQAGKMRWNESYEDVHMNIEQALTKIAPEAAKMHAGRSRNDQVATDMRLFFKDACGQAAAALDNALAAIVKLADKNQNVFIPGYTHLQRAQPVSAAHHLLAYAEMLERDKNRFLKIQQDANWCPLGSGAIAGTTVPIDREFTARYLGFVSSRGKPQVTQNSMDAVSDRDLFFDFGHACAVCGIHLSRIAEDLILWNSSEFSFIDLPDAFCTGSSLMPQKKNPDALELIRGKAGRLIGNDQSLLSMVKGLPLTYNRDLQEDKIPVFDSFDQALLCLQVLQGTLSGARFKAKACATAVADSLLLATDIADYLVERGVPFREAHHAVGKLVALAEKKKVSLDALTDQDAKSIHNKLGKDWRNSLDLDTAMKAREGIGMPGPKQIKRQIAAWKRLLG